MITDMAIVLFQRNYVLLSTLIAAVGLPILMAIAKKESYYTWLDLAPDAIRRGAVIGVIMGVFGYVALMASRLIAEAASPPVGAHALFWAYHLVPVYGAAVLFLPVLWGSESRLPEALSATFSAVSTVCAKLSNLLIPKFVKALYYSMRLSKCFGGKADHVRYDALRSLGKVRGLFAVARLSLALRDEDDGTRWRAAEVLGEMGDRRAVGPLVKSLSNTGDQIVFMKTAGALSKLGDRRAVKPLAGALEDENRRVRGIAARALGDLGDALAVGPLLKYLKHNEDEEALIALGKLGDERAVEGLVEILRGSEDEQRRRLVAELLFDFGRRDFSLVAKHWNAIKRRCRKSTHKDSHADHVDDHKVGSELIEAHGDSQNSAGYESIDIPADLRHRRRQEQP
ncbi:MAG: HEAT repeat domain-containing protein [bacterium]|nr:HEAT repeat domain-containing protein [bacterium]